MTTDPGLICPATVPWCLSEETSRWKTTATSLWARIRNRTTRLNKTIKSRLNCGAPVSLFIRYGSLGFSSPDNGEVRKWESRHVIVEGVEEWFYTSAIRDFVWLLKSLCVVGGWAVCFGNLRVFYWYFWNETSLGCEHESEIEKVLKHFYRAISIIVLY